MTAPSAPPPEDPLSEDPSSEDPSPDRSIELVRWRDGVFARDHDHVAAEEPLEIRVDGASVLVTMRTPGDDEDLALGLLYAEGILTHLDTLGSVARCELPGRTGDRVDVRSAPGCALDADVLRRAARVSSACGVCGRDALEAVAVRAAPLTDTTTIDPRVLTTLPAALGRAQAVFRSTGGLHAAGVFTAAGELLVAREDIGRHNAVDKVVGALLRRARVTGERVRAGRLALDGCVLMCSGRAGFEIVQKAAVAGISVVCAVSAPSSLAVSLARAQNVTLVGFLRGQTMNVYAGEARLGVQRNSMR